MFPIQLFVYSGHPNMQAASGTLSEGKQAWLSGWLEPLACSLHVRVLNVSPSIIPTRDFLGKFRA